VRTRHLPPERRAIVGRPPQRPGALPVLAHRAKLYAQSLGLPVHVHHSRVAGSGSRYLEVPVDWRRKPVILRISDHAKRHGTCADFEVITLDGSSGLPEAQRFLDLVVKGEVL
jgi:hypothetical protein